MKTLIKLGLCLFILTLVACSPSSGVGSANERAAFDALIEANIVLEYDIDLLMDEVEAAIATPAVADAIEKARNQQPLPPELEAAHTAFVSAARQLITDAEETVNMRNVVGTAYIDDIYEPAKTARLVRATQALGDSIYQMRRTLDTFQTQAEAYYTPPVS